MEKILVALDSSQLNMVSVDFACWLARLTNSKLIGVFLENREGSELPELTTIGGFPFIETITAKDIPGNKARKSLCDEAIVEFEAACARRGVRSSIHRDSTTPLQSLLEESKFADLLVIDPAMSFETTGDSVPPRFVEELLRGTECPVVLSPYSFNEVESIVFAYDGSPSALFALKQFTYLLPQLSGKRAHVIQAVKDEGMSKSERKQLGELLQPHYSSIGFMSITGAADHVLLDHLFDKKNSFLVLGAYGKSGFSRLLHQSTASSLIKTLNMPIFVAHK